MVNKPIQPPRVLAARLFLMLSLAFLIAIIGTAALPPVPAEAQSAQATQPAQKNLVADLGNFYTPAEEDQLRNEAAALGTRFQMDIVIVTTRSTGGKSTRAYADDYFDNNHYGVGPDRNGILFLLDYEHRETYISTSGSGIRYLTDQRIDQVLDAVIAAGLSNGRNFDATRAFLSKTAAFLEAGIPAGQYSEAERTRSITLVDALLGLIGAGGTGLGFFGATRLSYKGHPRRTGVFEFRGNSIVDMGIVTDNLVNTSVTTRHIPPPPPSGGGFSGRSTTHTSSSGRTHGGGGRGF